MILHTKGLLKEIQKSKSSKRKISFNKEGSDEIEDAIDEAIAQEEQQTSSQLPIKQVIGDASNVVKNVSSLCDLFSEVIKWIGPDNIVHIVTDNAANYVAAGRLINKNFKNIHWSPCAAHCLNHILKDISNMPHISNLATRALKITMFVYNHTVFLSWLRQRTTWKEIVRPGAIHFATIFITLKSIFECKMDLQALVVDTHFTGHKLGRSANGRAVSAIILDNKFWDDCFTICKIVSLLIKLLRLVDGDDKPSLGIVYKGILRSENRINEMFKHCKTAYQPYTKIINSRWDKHLKKNLHAAAYFLNPACFFDENYKEAPDVIRGLLDLVTFHFKNNNLDSVEAMKEIHLYRDRKESFDSTEAFRAAKKTSTCIDSVDFWVTEEVGEKEPDLPSNIEDLFHKIDTDLDQGGGGGGSSSTFYVAPLDFSGPNSEYEGDDIKEANLATSYGGF
ncbi:uncharacterized protein [Arachis hypogaea]|uniref:uncharacterized protein n=1 Tax=Arachis hypogaea TaxID=3818 RepID=UPI003B21C87C